jgi:hypothetical protein
VWHSRLLSLLIFSISVGLHVLLVLIATKAVMSGQRFRENAHLVQMTLYAGVGEAQAILPAPISRPTAPSVVRPVPPVAASLARPGSGAIGDAIPKAGLSEQATDVQDELPSTFLPSSEMERGAVPASEPDSQFLNGVENTGLPIRLRLYVDKHGVVKDIHTLQADDMDAMAVERLKAMFYATTFIPARREGKDMSSYMDIELNLAGFTGVSSAPVAPPQRP